MFGPPTKAVFSRKENREMVAFSNIDREINSTAFRDAAKQRPKLDAAGQIRLGVPVGAYAPSGGKNKPKKGREDKNHGRRNRKGRLPRSDA